MAALPTLGRDRAHSAISTYLTIEFHSDEWWVRPGW